MNIWNKVFKNGPSRLKETIFLQIFFKLSSTNFIWSILEYFVPYHNVSYLLLFGKRMLQSFEILCEQRFKF